MLYVLLYLNELFKLKNQKDSKEEIINELKFFLNQNQNTIDEIYNILLQYININKSN